MRLLHTSDWHLGRTLHGVDLTEHHAAYLDHLVDLARTEQVDAVVVAGDVYDRAVPPVEAVALLSETLRRLAEICTVVVTPGNHDSAARLGFGSELMRDGLHIQARVAGVGAPVVLRGGDGTDALVYGVPYLDPDVTRHSLAEVDADAERRGEPRVPLARSHAAVMGAAMARVRADVAARAGVGERPARTVVVAHAFVVGGAASESERDIRVGGVDHVPSGVFDGVDYVALGHLHGPQRVGDAGGAAGTVLRYSGSPLAYSFSEARHAKSTVLVELEGDRPVTTTLVPAPVPRALADVTGPLEDLLGAAGEAHVDHWTRVTVTDDVRPTDLYRRVRQRFPHALVVQHRPAGPVVQRRAAAVTAARDPLEVAADFVAHVRGSAPDAAEAAVLRRAYEQVVAAERSA